MKGSNRNHPCPCGSGRKLKLCCESAEKFNAINEDNQARLTALEAQRQADCIDAVKDQPRKRQLDRLSPLAIAVASAMAGPVVLENTRTSRPYPPR